MISGWIFNFGKEHGKHIELKLKNICWKGLDLPGLLAGIFENQ